MPQGGLQAPVKDVRLRSKPSSSASGTCVLVRCSHQAEQRRKTWDFQHSKTWDFQLGAAGAKTLPRCKGCWPRQPACPPAWHRCAAGRAEQHGKQILKQSRWYQLCINSLLQMVAAQELSPRCSRVLAAEVPAMPQPGTSLSISSCTRGKSWLVVIFPQTYQSALRGDILSSQISPQ